MKRIFILLVGAMMMSAVYAQVVQEGEAAIVYYSPQTTVTLDFTYTVVNREKGPYAAYAEEMLGVTDVVKANQSTYTLTNVRIGTRTGADYTRPHKVVAEPGFPLLLNLSDKGLLVGYNLPQSDKKQERNNRSHYDKEEKTCSAGPAKAVPYPEEALKASSPVAQARAIAKQIFHLRETRMYLINGEVENAPADGEAMRLVLTELDKQEAELTALFTGKTITRRDHKIIRFNPAEDAPILYFSEENGFTDAENIDATSVQLQVFKNKQRLNPAPEPDPKAKKKVTGSALSQLVYNLPGSAEITVVYKGQTLGKNTVSVAQLGVDVPLAKDIFSGSELPVIEFNEQTGNIVSIAR